MSMSMSSIPISTALLALLAAAGTIRPAAANSDASFTELQQHLSPDPGDILENLDQWEKLWIEVPKFKRRSSSELDELTEEERRAELKKHGSCVWSECALDDTDDAVQGDYRDGDEQWYQYRTQSFCANAAYSLYGIKKEAENKGVFGWLTNGGGGWGGCQKKHFINSFFTYGGADNLLAALGEVPVVYYDDDDDDGGNDDAGGRRRLEDAADGDDAAAANDDAAAAAADDDGWSSQSANAVCTEIDYYEDDDDDQAADEEDADEEDADEDANNDRNRERRLSGSGDADNDGYSSSLGCASDGSYIVAAFQGNSCDGNYFLDSIDDFDDYNAQHSSVGCQKIYTEDNAYDNADYSTIYKLLSNSWTCDIRLYPNACPDPWGEKGWYEYALRSASHGVNPMWTYKNEILRGPLRTLSWVLVALTVAVLMLTYVVKNHRRILGKMGGSGEYLMGVFRVVKEDIFAGLGWIKVNAVMGWEWTKATMKKGIVGAKVKAVLWFEKTKVRHAMRNKKSTKAGSGAHQQEDDDYVEGVPENDDYVEGVPENAVECSFQVEGKVAHNGVVA